MKIIGIIPLRYGSTRFPGKPLLEIKGKTMIQRVYEQAQKAVSLSYLTVATDSEKIKENVDSFGGVVIMTSDKHQSGTERCCEAAEKLQPVLNLDDDDIILNIQGDEPFIAPESLDLVTQCFKEKKAEIVTLVKPIVSPADLFDSGIAKVILNQENEIMYFSRAAIPYLRDKKQGDWSMSHLYLKQIGVYGYRFGILKEISRLKPTPLEMAEKLEQLRWLENGYHIMAQMTPYESFSIDTPEDLMKIGKFIK